MSPSSKAAQTPIITAVWVSARKHHKARVAADKENAKARGLKPATPGILLPVRRWASLFAALGKLNAEYNDSQVHNNLDELARSLQTLLYRIRLLFPKQLDGAVFHILNLHHIVTVLHAAFESPLRTQLSSEVLSSTSGGLGEDAMATCKALESSLELVRSQYKEEMLGSHVKELMAYLSQAQAQLQAGKDASALEAILGGPAKPRVRLFPSSAGWPCCSQLHRVVWAPLARNFRRQ